MSQLIEFYIPASFVRKSGWKSKQPGKLIYFPKPNPAQPAEGVVWRRHRRASGSNLDWMKMSVRSVFDSHPGLE
jgi:hypothetical protein